MRERERDGENWEFEETFSTKKVEIDELLWMLKRNWREMNFLWGKDEVE
jgi:hypothetical protein